MKQLYALVLASGLASACSSEQQRGGGPASLEQPATVASSVTFDEVKDLLCKTSHSFPVKSALALPADAMAHVWTILGDLDMAPCWKYGVLTVGTVGQPDDLQKLIDEVLLTTSPGSYTATHGDAMKHAVYAVGYIAGRFKGTATGDTATQFLIDCSDADYFAGKSPAWMLSDGWSGHTARACVSALSYTGSQAARDHLVELSQDPDVHPKFSGDAATAVEDFDHYEQNGFFSALEGYR